MIRILALSAALSLNSYAQSTPPHIGDYVEYERQIKDSSGQRALKLSREIVSYSEDTLKYRVQFGKYEGSSWKYWFEELQFINYSYNFYDECVQHYGHYKIVNTQLGTMPVCERQNNSQASQYTDYHGRVPFGLVLSQYSDPTVEFKTELVNFKFGP